MLESRPNFFGLLHIAETITKPINSRFNGDPIDIYLYCADLCARSFAWHGYKFKIVTNYIDRVEERISKLNLANLNPVQYEFKLDVPQKIKFHSAHFKLELIDAFGQGVFGDYVGLVDIDTVLLKDFDYAIFRAPGLTGYDLTRSEINDYGEHAIKNTFASLIPHEIPLSWWGGEFMLGHAYDFALISKYIAKIWPEYVREWRNMSHHQGDEVLISAAIALMKRDGIVVTDAGSLHGVHRWWSARTLSQHASLTYALSRSLIHLPADKDFLAAQSIEDGFHPAAFVSAFSKTAKRKATARMMIDMLRRFQRERPRKYAPKIR